MRRTSFCNLGAQVLLDLFRVGALDQSLNPPHLHMQRATISAIVDALVERASASLQLLNKTINPLQRGKLRELTLILFPCH